MLCHCVWGVSRYAQDRDAVLGSGLLVDIVEAGAAQEDQSDTAVMQLLDDRTRCLVVDEDADSVIAVGEVCRLIRQAAREILEFDVVRALALVLCELAEVEAVIVFRAEKGDLEDRALLLLRAHGIENSLDLLCSLFLIRAVHGDIDRCGVRSVKGQELPHLVGGVCGSEGVGGCSRARCWRGLCVYRPRASPAPAGCCMPARSELRGAHGYRVSTSRRLGIFSLIRSSPKNAVHLSYC